MTATYLADKLKHVELKARLTNQIQKSILESISHSVLE